MFSRPHHQRIARILDKLDADLLQQADCYFGGGTAIVLRANEYRESIDIDFLCASHAGYRQLRELVSENSLGAVFKEPIALARTVRKDRDKIFTAVDDGTGEPPIRLEIVLEGRIEIAGERDPRIPVAVLTKADLYAEKILANSDRWADVSTLYRDAIDLAMMVDQWGAIPQTAIDKASEVYGKDALGALRKVTHKLVTNPGALDKATGSMGMDGALSAKVIQILQDELTRIEGSLVRGLDAEDEPPSPGMDM